MPETATFDAIIIGTGQGGRPLAKELAKAGWQVAIIESNHVGGSCINYGCTPTKTMLASAKTAHTCRNAAEYGVNTGNTTVDLAAVKKRRDAIVKQFREGAEESLSHQNITLLHGHGAFIDTQTVEVKLSKGGQQQVSSSKIIINTGATPNIPEIEGLQNIAYLNHTTIQELTELPEHLLILGGGYIGLEFGQMFRRFGSKVTIIHHSEHILDREDKDVANALKEILEDEGIRILLNAETQEATQREGEITLSVRTKAGHTEMVTGSLLLVATGVKANTQHLGLQHAGIETDEKGNIQVNATLETNIKGIYAIGDVKGGPQFTHISYDDFRVLRDNLLQHKHRNTNSRHVPYCVFTDPQLGRVGLSEKEAEEQGIKYSIAKLPMNTVARGIETGHTKGFYKVLVNKEDDTILGAAILAPEGGELMAALEIAMMGKVKYTQLQEGVFAHPTYAESFNNLFKKLDEGS